MKKKMYSSSSKVGYAKGGYASISDMEKRCASKTAKKTKQ